MSPDLWIASGASGELTGRSSIPIAVVLLLFPYFVLSLC